MLRFFQALISGLFGFGLSLKNRRQNNELRMSNFCSLNLEGGIQPPSALHTGASIEFTFPEIRFFEISTIFDQFLAKLAKLIKIEGFEFFGKLYYCQAPLCPVSPRWPLKDSSLRTASSSMALEVKECLFFYSADLF